MRRLSLRCAGAALLLALALPLSYPSSQAAAAGPAVTDFTRVTPADAVLYATYQSSSASQARNVSALANTPALQTLLNTLLNVVLASGTGSGTGSGSIPGFGGPSGGAPATGGSQILGLLGGYLGKLVNGQLALSVLPPAQAQSGGATSRLHALIDVGLQPGANLSSLLGGAALFGFPSASVQPYRGIAITSVDLNRVAKLVGTLTKNKQLAGATLIPKNDIISSVFYAATVGDVAVLASDLPTLHAAIDTHARVTPSIGSSAQYTDVAGLLPIEHFTTVYLHLGTDTLSAVLSGAAMGALGSLAQLIPPTTGTGGLNMALALTAQQHRLVATSSTAQGVTSRIITLPGMLGS